MVWFKESDAHHRTTSKIHAIYTPTKIHYSLFYHNINIINFESTSAIGVYAFCPIHCEQT